MHFAGNLRLGKLHRVARVLLGQFKPLMQLLLESTVANLLQDIGVASLVNFEGFVAVGADDFVHVCASGFVAPKIMCFVCLSNQYLNQTACNTCRRPLESWRPSGQ